MNGTIATSTTGAATGGCRTLLRLEGLTLFLGMTMLYAVWGGSWWVYAVLFLVPDLSFAGYLAGPRIGAIVYNAAHSYMAPMALMTTGFGLASPLTLSTPAYDGRPSRTESYAESSSMASATSSTRRRTRSRSSL